MSAIDDIFSKKKTSKTIKPSIPEAEAPKVLPKKSKKKETSIPKQSSADATKPIVQVVEFKEACSTFKRAEAPAEQDGFGDSRGNKGKRRKIDELDLYSTEELNIGKGGDTEDCPFDCKCCY
jgi:hypothetical protein